MTYSNLNTNTSQATVYSGGGSPVASYDTLELLPSVQHAAQISVERIFTTESSGSTNTLEAFLSSPNVSAFHKRNIFRLSSDKVIIDENTKKIQSLIGLPYDYTLAAGFSVKVPVLSSGQTITVERKTISNPALVTWLPGTKITASQLNTAVLQSIYLGQEILSLLDRKFAYANTPAVDLVDGLVQAAHITATNQNWVFNGPVDINGLLTVDGLALGGLSSSLPVFTNSSGQLTTNPLSGTGSVIMSQGATFTGTPPTLVGTNITGTAAGLIAGTVVSLPTLSGDVSNIGNVVTVLNVPNLSTLNVAHSASIGTNLSVGGLGTFNNTVLIKGDLTVLGDTNFSSTSSSQQVSVDSLFYIGTTPCTFTGSISGTELTVAASPAIVGSLSVGALLTWAEQSGYTPRVTAFGTGSGGTGTYVVTPSGTQSSIVMTGQGKTDATADGGGIELMATTNRSIRWYDTNDEWLVSDHLKLANTKVLRLGSSSLGAGGALAFTLPTSGSAGSLVSATSTDTFTNKTINSAASGANTIQIDGTPATSNTGTGAVVRASTPTLTGAILSGNTQLGTPLSGTLTNCTGLPIGGLLGHGQTGGNPASGIDANVGTFLRNSTASNFHDVINKNDPELDGGVGGLGATGTGRVVFQDGPEIGLGNCVIPIDSVHVTGTLIPSRGGTGYSTGASVLKPGKHIMRRTGSTLYQDDTAGYAFVDSGLAASGSSDAGKVLTISASEEVVWAPGVTKLVSNQITISDSISPTASVTKTLTITGAVSGDFVVLSFTAALPIYIKHHTWVSSANTVSVQFYNIHTSQPQSLTGNLKAMIIR